jgi:chromosome segregation ATPase
MTRQKHFTFWLLRLFPEYREMEKTLRKKDEAQELGAAIIRSYRQEMNNLRKKAESDAALIDSLNRYIEALEGKAAMQADMLKDLNRGLKEIIARPKNGWHKKD